MTDFRRKGHWRLLSDGTRTWVAGHYVVRDRIVQHGYEDAVLKRRIKEKSNSGCDVASNGDRATHDETKKAARKRTAGVVGAKWRKTKFNKARRKAKNRLLLDILARQKRKQKMVTIVSASSGN